MAYTDIDDPTAFFQTAIYTGNGGTQSITNTGNSDLQPDWVWIKKRSGAASHILTDSVRGVTKNLFSDKDEAEETISTRITAFNSDGFSLGAEGNVNASSTTYVGWQWKAGTSFTNDASSTSVGSIDSAGSVSTAAGFSIVTFTGNSGGIAHGLGQKPDMVIIKPRNVSGSWIVTHKGLGAEMQDYYVFLDTTAAKATSNDIWGGEPTTTTFSVSSSLIDSANYVAYCFAEKQGYSKIGSYTGNGNADGSFVYTGFKPAWIIFKRLATNDWFIVDNKIHDFNKAESDSKMLRPNLANAEQANNTVDLLSNGFKARNANDAYNASGSTYIYMAFAEQPFVTSTGVPATAR